MSNYYSFVFSLMALSDTNISNTFQPLGANAPIPSMGFGTFMLSNETELTNALNKALEAGYRHFDTASLYENEHVIGNVLKNWISSQKIKRKDLFITTKLHPLDLDPDKVEAALNKSLSNLKLKYVDSYLIHMPIGLKKGKNTTFVVAPPVNFTSIWRKMEEQVQAKRTRTIGLRDFNKKQIKEILSIAKIRPAIVQIEVHPYHQEKELRAFCKKHSILIVGYAPLGSWEFNKYFKNGQEAKSFDILKDFEILKLAQKYNKTTSQIVLRYLHQLHVVIIPRTLNLTNIEDNSKIFNFYIRLNDTKIMQKLDKGFDGKIYDMLNFAPNIGDHPDYPLPRIRTTSNVYTKDL